MAFGDARGGRGLGAGVVEQYVMKCESCVCHFQAGRPFISSLCVANGALKRGVGAEVFCKEPYKGGTRCRDTSLTTADQSLYGGMSLRSAETEISAP